MPTTTAHMINNAAELRAALEGMEGETLVRIQVQDDIDRHLYLVIEAVQTVAIITDGPHTWLEHAKPPQWNQRCSEADYTADNRRLTRPGKTEASRTPGTDSTLCQTANILAICFSEGVQN